MGVSPLNNLSPQLISQLYAQNSSDPFLILLTFDHSSFVEAFRVVNNSVAITSNGNVFEPYPFKITLPVEDGETARSVKIEIDNTSLELIDELRSITDFIDVKVEMILSSLPNTIQMSLEELKIQSISYNVNTVSLNLVLDDFMNVEVIDEKYNPDKYPGLF
jgi:hypothetical protein